MNLCIVANSDKAIKGLLLAQIRFFQEKGYGVSVACRDTGSFQQLLSQGIQCHNILFVRSFSSFISHGRAFFQLLFLFRREKFFIVHTHNPIPGFLGQIAAWAARVPIRFNTIHGFYFHERSGKIQRFLFLLLEKISGLCSHHLFSQSKEDVETAIREKIVPKEKITHIGNGIDLSRFSPATISIEQRKQKKAELSLKGSVIGIVGRLVREKGYLELLEAFRELRQRFPDTILMIIGGLEQEKQDRIGKETVESVKGVRYLGEREDMEVLYSIMDIFTLPSWREGFPRSVMEASAMGLPVVATDIRGCREAVLHGETGILVPAKNAPALTRALEDLLSDARRRESMGRAGNRYAQDFFNEGQVHERIWKQYQLKLNP